MLVVSADPARNCRLRVDQEARTVPAVQHLDRHGKIDPRAGHNPDGVKRAVDRIRRVLTYAAGVITYAR
jgi:hypothetical protein